MNAWMIITLETQLDWPTEETRVEFEGHALFLRPPDRDCQADIRLEYEHPQSERQAYETICRFLSILSWSRRRPARVARRIGCSGPDLRLAKGVLVPDLRKDYCLPKYVQLPSDPKALLALALYREALSHWDTPYGFLGYFKIINILYSNRKKQISWVNRTIPRLSDPQARKRVDELAHSEPDIGHYLYTSGRCAVAHANTNPVVDPDSAEDVFRLSADMPLMRALAEHLIEHELGIAREVLE